jgi:hypothetical protein
MKPGNENDGRKRGNAPEPGHPRDDGDVVRPEDRIHDRDHRVGRQIKREQPSGDEPGYANDDNLPNH